MPGLAPGQNEEIPQLPPNESLVPPMPVPAAAPAQAQATQPQTAAPVAQPAPSVPQQSGGSGSHGAPQQPQQPQFINPFNKNDLDADDIAYQQDLAAKKIEPKTYQDLFAKKSTPGKLGTLFGLMLSGAGSGLTKQPNMLMEMMNKEINNDLEAQKVSKEGARNFLQLSMQHDLNKANIKSQEYQNALTMGQVAMMPGQMNLVAAQTAAVNAQNAGLASLNNAKNKMLSTVYQDWANTIAKMPDGPQKIAAQNMLDNTIAPAVTAEIQKNNAETESKTNFNFQNASKKEQAEVEKPAVDLDRMQRLIDLGKADQQIPGVMLGSDVGAANAEAQNVMDNRAVAKMFEDSFRKLDRLDAGKLNPALRQAEIATLMARIGRETAGRYVTKEVEAQAEGMLPSPKDYGKAREEKYTKAMQYFKDAEGATPTLDRFKLKSPFPEYAYKKSKSGKVAGKGGGEPLERKTRDGKIALFDPKTNKFMGYKGDSATASSEKPKEDWFRKLKK